MTASITGALLHAAHADAWQEHGRVRRPHGGDHADVPGARLMSSGLPFTQWNTADVLDPGTVDVAAVWDWYAARGLPWGVRLAAGSRWPYGRHVVRQRLMGQAPDGFRPAPDVPGVVVRVAGPDDLEAVAGVDAAAFDAEPGPSRRWLAPLLGVDAGATAGVPGTPGASRTDRARLHDAVTVVVAHDSSGPVGTAYTVRSDGLAGPAVLLAGVAVVPRARRRGIASALSTALLSASYDSGARLGHLQPDDDAAAAVYRRLGFVEAGALDVYVDVPRPAVDGAGVRAG